MDNKVDDKQIKMTFSDIEMARLLFGEQNNHLDRIQKSLDLKIYARGNTVSIQGNEIESQLARNVLEQLYKLIKKRYPIFPNDVDYAIRTLRLLSLKISLWIQYILHQKRDP